MAETNEEPGTGASCEVPEALPPSSHDSPPSTATPLSIKCSELTNGGFPRNGTTLIKTKNYKAGSKINQLADMLAKRSLKLAEVSENGEGAVACLLARPVQEPQPLPPPPAPGESLKSEGIASPPQLPTEPQVIAPPPTAFNDSGNSTKEKPVKTRTSPRCRKEVDTIQTDSVVRRAKTKNQTRRSKKLVEMSTQTAEIQFITIEKKDEAAELALPVAPQEEEVAPATVEDQTPPVLSDATDDTLARLTGIETPTFICLFCQLTFDNKTDCLNHEATHSLKRKTKFIKCQFCLKKLPNLEEFKSHATRLHRSNFHLCTDCDLRFIDNNSLILHAKLHHYHPDPLEKYSILNKKVRTGGSLDIDVRQSASLLRCPQKNSPKEKTEEQLYEAEMLFYSHLSGNIQENLSKHLDGKIDQQDSGCDVAEPVRTSCLLAVAPSASGATSVPVSRAPSPYQTRSKTPNPLPTSAKKFKKLPNWQQKFWEKYNFPTNYRFEHRFWDKNYIQTDKSALYLKDLSCLDIKTQLTMRENVKKLEEGPNDTKDDDERLKDSFPYFLNLVPGVEASPPAAEAPAPSTVTPVTTKPKKKGKGARRSTTPQVVTRRQSGMDADQKRTLRRQTSLDNLEDGKDGKETKELPTPVADDASDSSKETIDSAETTPELSEISGEWVRPRSYLCGTCCAKFTGLWDLEEHKWAAHPNVWCTHYEFEDDKLDKLFQLEAHSPQIKPITLPDLYRRYLQPQGSLHAADTVAHTAFPQPCTKCSKPCASQPELHKHMLDCGGDTTWFLTMSSSPAAMKRRWRPYGSRRRKQIGQRGVKRNIPATPTLRSYCTQPKIRTKPGDVESIQKMLANLPEKRTRRAINFDEVNTRSQTTIHSNRLLRKRFNVSFGSNFLRRKVLTTARERQRKASSASPAGSSSVSPSGSPSGSPKRRFRLKEVTVDVTPLTLPPALFPARATRPARPTLNSRRNKKPIKMEADKEDPKEEKSTVAEAKLKKKMVERKGYLVKKIKKKLKTSKKLLEVREENRRRSERIKENLSKDESAGEEFTAEEAELPIAKLTEKKKAAKKGNAKTSKPADLAEMPVLDREEPAKRRGARKSDPDLPVLKPFEDEEKPLVVAEEQNVRFKVVKKVKKKASKNAAVTPLKLVKEQEPVADELTPKVVSNGVLENAVGESGSDSEPLIALKNPSVADKAKKKNISRKRSKIKRKVVPKVLTQNEEGAVKAETPLLQVEEKALHDHGVSEAEKLLPEVEESPPVQPSVIATTDIPSETLDSKRFTNFMMERIISDKLNERLVKRKKGTSNHKRGKVQPPPQHTLKRLRMTVTLKEATLKVLDKPLPPVSALSKWTTHVTDFVKLDAVPVVVQEDNLTGGANCAPGDVKIAPTIPEPVKLRPKRRLSKNVENTKEEVVKETKSSEADTVNSCLPLPPLSPLACSVFKLELVPPESPITRARSKAPTDDNPESAIPIRRVSSETREKRTSTETKESSSSCVLEGSWKGSLFIETRENGGPCEINAGSAIHETEPGENLSPCVLESTRKSSDDVSTTVPSVDEKEAACVTWPISTRKVSADEGVVEEPVMTVDTKKAVTPMLTIEEATSSEDAMIWSPAKSPSVSCHAKIAEADSSAEVTTKENRVETTEELKVEPEMVVSSTEPVFGKNKKSKGRRKKVVVDFECKDEVPSSTLLIPEELDRRSRRKSKEVPSTNEFIIDDPLLLVDELWSDLDSDSDSRHKRKLKRVKKKTPKKKTLAGTKVDLEALLRNFGENKEMMKCLPRRRKGDTGLTSRQRIERKVVLNENAYKRLSLRLFSFNRKVLRYGHRGSKLLKVKKVLLETLPLPKLPFLPSEVTENPEQVIVCHSTKVRSAKKNVEETEVKEKKPSVPQLKVSLPLELLGDLSILNNNTLRAAEPEPPEPPKQECCSRPATPDVKPFEVKQKRSDVIDKIFYCEICKTYYYSPSQLKSHKMSNRHKLKEAEILEEESEEAEVAPEPVVPVMETPSATETAEPPVDKGGDDSLEMPVLEGPFIETRGDPRSEPPPTSSTQSNSVLGFSEESLKDIQKAIGCTDEEMLILTLLGENTVPEPDILDISNFTNKAEAEKRIQVDGLINRNSCKTNGALKVDLKQRMTTALASLVNRAVSNLLNKSERGAFAASEQSSDAATFLSKLSGLSGQRTTSLLQAELALEQSIPPPVPPPSVSETSEGHYQYQCTICGNRFEKESTRDFHMVRTHRLRKRPKPAARPSIEEQMEPVPCDDWNESWYEPDDFNDPAVVPPSQFWCSDCGINFLSPKEVLEHQRAEHPPELPRAETGKTEDVEEAKPSLKRTISLDPDQERLLANQELQKLVSRRQSKKSRRPQFGMDALKFTKSEHDKPERRKSSESSSKKKIQLDESWNQKSVDIYDFNEFDSDPEPVVLAHVRKSAGKGREVEREVYDVPDGDDSEDNLPLSSVKVPRLNARETCEVALLVPSDSESNNTKLDPELKTSESDDTTHQTGKESFKISLENRFLRLDEITLKKNSPPDSEEDDSIPLFLMSKKELPSSASDPPPLDESDNEINENVIYHTNDSVSSFEDRRDDDPDDMSTRSTITSDSEDESAQAQRQKKIVPLLTATLTNNDRKSESPKLNKEVIVKKIWSRQKCNVEDGSSRPSEINKDTIMKRVWKKKRADTDRTDTDRSGEDVKIKQTEFSDEVVIKCGPKPKPSIRRRSLNEPAKDAIVRRIWSGKCGFQTKAALKTYDSDMVATPAPPPSPPPPPQQQQQPSAAKRRGRPASLSAVKRKKVSSSSEDDLDSLLEEIEQENVEKAIRLEFLHLRRSEKNQAETAKEPAGLFAEIQPSEMRNTPEKKRRKIRKNVGVLKRRQDMNDFRNRRHKKHRHHHHHHKHKHKNHHKHHSRLPSTKHRHRPGAALSAAAAALTTTSRPAVEPELEPASGRDPEPALPAEPRISSDLDNLDLKLDEILSPYECGSQLNGDVSEDDLLAGKS